MTLSPRDFMSMAPCAYIGAVVGLDVVAVDRHARLGWVVELADGRVVALGNALGSRAFRRNLAAAGGRDGLTPHELERLSAMLRNGVKQARRRREKG